MLWKTHAGAAACLALLANPGLDLADIALGTGLCVAGALLVDIDEPASTIGRRIPLIPPVLKLLRTGYSRAGLLVAAAVAVGLVALVSGRISAFMGAQYGLYIAMALALMIFGMLAAVFAHIQQGHRGPLHTPCTALVVTATIAWAAPCSPLMPGEHGPIMLLMGMLSHLALDSLDEHGIAWLWPMSSQKYGLGLLTTGGWLDRLFLGPGFMGAAALLLALKLGTAFPACRL